MRREVDYVTTCTKNALTEQPIFIFLFSKQCTVLEKIENFDIFASRQIISVVMAKSMVGRDPALDKITRRDKRTQKIYN